MERLHENLFNFAKKDFSSLPLLYIAIIFAGSSCLFPVCHAFEVSEQKEALAEIRDYASSMLGELDLQESLDFPYHQKSFTATGILLRSIMIVHEAPLLPCFMTLTRLQSRIRLYYQESAIRPGCPGISAKI